MRAKFVTELVVSPMPESDVRWRLDAPLTYLAGAAHDAHLIRVPAGFETDFASIPRFFWRVLLPTGRGREAAVVHDWLYARGDRHRLVADGIFLEGLTALGVPGWRRWAMFLAVALFGGWAWRKHRRVEGRRSRVERQ